VNETENRTPLLRVEDLSVRFPIKQGILDAVRRREKTYLTAVDLGPLDIYPGDTLGLVGESGCGKSSLARAIVGLYRPTGGKVILSGVDLTGLSKKERRASCGDIQMVFQDPYSSLNPRMSVRAVLREELTQHRVCPPAEIDGRIARLLEMVGLSAQLADRLPASFSGGQRQRIGIARALALNPQVVIADEPVSALDVSIQAQVINLLIDLQKQLGLTLLFISHDLQVVRYISNRVAVMYLGKILEMGEADELFDRPLHPYTDILLKAAPRMDSEPGAAQGEVIHGDLPSPIHLPSGCRFHPRCPYATAECSRVQPELQELRPGHLCACHHPLGLEGER